MKRVLIIKASSLGDVIQALPVAAWLKNIGCSVEWVVEKKCEEPLFLTPSIDRIISFEKRQLLSIKGRRALQQQLGVYDVIFDLQGNCKSALLLSLARGHKIGFGRKTVREWPNLLFTHRKMNPKATPMQQYYLQMCQDYFHLPPTVVEVPIVVEAKIEQEIQTWIDRYPRPRCLVFPFSRWRSKEVSLNALRGLQIPHWSFIVCWSSTEERKRAESMGYPCIPRLFSLAELYVACHQVEAIVTMDSMPLHLASLTDTPTFAFFGPSAKQYYLPLNKEGVQGTCPYRVSFAQRCPYLRTCPAECIKTFSALQVQEHLRSFLDHVYGKISS